jgi:signal transduction histidine kinase
MMIYSPYRKDSTNYSRAVFRLYYQIVYRKNDDATFNFRDLRGKHIAHMNSRPIGQMLEQEHAIGHQVTDLSQAFTDLSNNKYDAVICFRYQSRYIITRNNLVTLKAEDMSLQPREYCYVSHSKVLIEAINQALKELDEEGVIDDIYGKDIKSQFGSIEIPEWIWMLLVGLIVAFLVVLVFIFRHSNKKLAAEHQKLQEANSLLAERNKELITANERALESSRIKTAFIQQISHEIRTPLNVLNGFTQILTTSELELGTEEKADIGHRINENTVRITGLVNKMLELSEANSQTIIPRDDLVDAEQIAQKAVNESGIQSASHLSFQTEIEPDCKAIKLQTNLRQAARALALLLDNAQKFTAEGHVMLRISQQDSYMEFAVEDTGMGIPSDKAEYIFEAFVQLDEYYDGTGIGLTVARSIARRLDGNIVFDTGFHSQESGQGSRFVLTLPIAS